MSEAGYTKVRLNVRTQPDQLSGVIEREIGASLKTQGISATHHERPKNFHHWVLDQRGSLSVTVSGHANGTFIDMDVVDPTEPSRAAQLAGISAHLCTVLNVRTVYWNGVDVALPRDAFLEAVTGTECAGETEPRHTAPSAEKVQPRKVAPLHAPARQPRAPARGAWFESPLFDGYSSRLIRRTLTQELDEHEIEEMEIAERRAQSAPIRLAAWVVSFAAAMIALPLALPIVVHNLLRGEDLRAAALSLAVAGFYATLWHTGMSPDLTGLL